MARMEEHWCTSPMYEDAAEFLKQITLLVYFVTNSDDRYIYESMERNGIYPAGVFTSEQAKYSKPRKEIFQYALDKIGLKPEEVIHIGDSLESDVKCPGQAGIKSIWLNREGKAVPDGVEEAENLMEALRKIRETANI